MTRWQRAGAGLTLLAAVAVSAADPPAKDGFPRFKVQEIATDLKIGYAVITPDVNGDGKPDVVVVDQHRVVWYENPTWKVRTILQGKTKPDNVCIAAVDIDGGGDVELVLGAAWKPTDTNTPGTLQWLKRGKSLDDEWTMYTIPCDEPTVHRVRVSAKTAAWPEPRIIVAPLQGRNCTAKGNWTDGRPVKILSYPIPKNPTDPTAWKPDVIAADLHVVHNFTLGEAGGNPAIIAASYEGATSIARGANGQWKATRLDDADQRTPKGSRGASEVKLGGAAIPFLYMATIEPWHGNQVVVYTGFDGNPGPWKRQVLDNQLRWGHAVSCEDLDGDGFDELIVGVRDDPNPKLGDKHIERRGVRIYKNADGKGSKWDRQLIDAGGVAVEDLAVADLNGDGKPDIVAVGRATGNCRVYWNQGK